MVRADGRWFSPKQKMLANLHTKQKLGHIKYIDLRACLSNNLRCLHDREGHNYGDTEDCVGEFELDSLLSHKKYE